MIYSYDNGKTNPQNRQIYTAANNLQQANLCSSEHGKLCSLLHEILLAARNNLPPALRLGAVYSIVVNRAGRSLTVNNYLI
ncbi:hypothetical protein IR083_22300 [Dysgonomonas sp. GY75]|uniref:hypothetical protein n=1 Tax=Dysgonomonas sp. GY75 TaxID=2780419 RepID=UPI0019E31CB0|nr:hypothetical protein [Dysgonomonas sp. GY75]MBF0651552.1 hypothetical protein [Dysgonomonas sp. GY75]